MFNKGKNGTVTEGQVLDVLKKVQDPDLHKDIVSLGFIRNLKIDNGNVAFDLNLTTPACPVKDQMRDEAVALDAGKADATLFLAFILAGVGRVAIEASAVIEAQLVTHCDWVIVGQRKIEPIPTPNRPHRQERAAITDAREMKSVAAHR